MSNYKTPNVYVEEISTLPPSVAGVSTAVPAFIGYTEKQPDGANGISVRRISNFFEYKALYGGSATKAEIEIDLSNNVVMASANNDNLIMYYALQHYFENGGGPCYVVSIGLYANDKAEKDFSKGLDELAKKDEPTLIVLTDGLRLVSDKKHGTYYSMCQRAINQCEKLMDRFAIIDVSKDDIDADGNVGGELKRYVGNYLSYGAAYFPYLRTALNYSIKEAKISIKGSVKLKKFPDENATLFTIVYRGTAPAPEYSIEVTVANQGLQIRIHEGKLEIKAAVDKTIADLKKEWFASKRKLGFDIFFEEGVDSSSIPSAVNDVLEHFDSVEFATLGSLNESKQNTSLYNSIKKALDELKVTLPPSAAVAGAYASTDRSRGVWKAPANLSLNSVIAPTMPINDEQQGRMNVDSDAGKSINAIRSFTGKGTLIWGSRTLDGNSNEWRYVPVRRLFNYVEESIKKASAFAVFEPNTQITWLKVRSMIDSFLFSLWEQGAFSGSTKEEAYFINVGLGSTMTQQDILEGRMIIEIGLAAVRPAEFIILRFSHFVQES